uniref:Uncharacterized protein n=1 Tax=Cacopsylla melanoneura TaxID=428564 RepID=A0A8D8Z9R1_9HEMI
MAVILLTFMLVGSVLSTLKSQDFHEEKAHEVYDNFFQGSFKKEDNLLGSITKGNKKEIEIIMPIVDTGQTNKHPLQRMRREIETTTTRLDQTNDEKQNGQDHERENIGQESKEDQETESQHNEHYPGQDSGLDDGLRNTLKRAFKLKYQMNVDARNYKEKNNETSQQNGTLGHQDTEDDEDSDYDSEELFDENINEIGSSEEPFINKTIPLMFPVYDGNKIVPGQKIMMNTPYQRRGNVIRFPSNYKEPLRRMQKYAKGKWGDFPLDARGLGSNTPRVGMQLCQRPTWF